MPDEYQISLTRRAGAQLIGEPPALQAFAELDGFGSPVSSKVRVRWCSRRCGAEQRLVCVARLPDATIRRSL
jgi:hypothetical protein